MKNAEVYKESCEVLYQAYFNNTLEHGSPCNCAIGNLLQARGVYKPDDWFHAILNTRHYCHVKDFELEQGMRELSVLSYSLEQVIEIENAFEAANAYENKDSKMFHGLAAVIEVLNKIHEVEKDVETPRFKSLYETKCNV